MENPPLEIVSQYGSRSRKRCMEHALVLEAVGIRYEVLAGDDGLALAVDARDLARAFLVFWDCIRRCARSLAPQKGPCGA